MRIGIEAQRMFRREKHGMDRVAIELIKGLQQIDTNNQYFIFVKEDTECALLETPSNFRVVTIKSAPYPYWEQVLLPREIRKYSLDILHCTSNTAPIRLGVPLVVTIHDIIYLESTNLTRGSLYQIVGNFYRKWNVPRVARRASNITTVSDFERQNIMEYFQFPGDRVVTIHNAASDWFRRVEDPKVLEVLSSRYNLPDKYILCLGSRDPRKNIKRFVEAIGVLQERNRLDFKVVMVGVNAKHIRGLLTDMNKQSLDDIFVCPGYVPDEDLPAIYTMAEIFVYPSTREGFGIPILEAMACETPVITSNTSSMPEVAGEAAYLIDPYNPVSIADGIDHLLRNKSLQQELVERAKTQQRKFTWINSAAKALRLYEKVGLGKNNP